MELKVLSERERRNGEETTTTIQTGKGSEAEKREMCLKGENKVRGWEEHGGPEKAAKMRLKIENVFIPPFDESMHQWDE